MTESVTKNLLEYLSNPRDSRFWPNDSSFLVHWALGNFVHALVWWVD
jgi:hypothetical protein